MAKEFLSFFKTAGGGEGEKLYSVPGTGRRGKISAAGL